MSAHEIQNNTIFRTW